MNQKQVNPNAIFGITIGQVVDGMVKQGGDLIVFSMETMAGPLTIACARGKLAQFLDDDCKKLASGSSKIITPMQ